MNIQESRYTPRERVTLPVKLGDGGKGITRDISASGLFFESSTQQQVGAMVDIEVFFDRPGTPLKLKARGTVIRVERGVGPGKSGVALRLLDSFLDPVV